MSKPIIKKYYKSKKMKKLLFILFITSTLSVFSQVGIGTITPEQTLDVAGNLKIDGSFMPNNLSGDAKQVLQSTGVEGEPPIWGLTITQHYTDAMTLEEDETYRITTFITGVTTSSGAFVTVQGNWNGNNKLGKDLTIHNVEARTGAVRFVVETDDEEFEDIVFTITVIQ